MSVYSKFWPKGGLPGILHHYTETLVTFEYTHSNVRKPHSLVFIGGLGDGLATTSYLNDLERALRPTEWSLFTLNLTSSYQSWGVGHLDRDTNEVAQCLKYVKEYKTTKFGDDNKLVLMGHSTGSQCLMHYLYQPNPHIKTSAFDPDLEHPRRLPLDGAIMQAPVSDRECVHLILKHGFNGRTASEMQAVYDEMEAMSREAAAREDQTHDILLPLSMTSAIYPANTPLSCRRFLSLISPDTPHTPSEDDLFSSDMTDEQLSKTFGQIKPQGLLKGKLTVLFSGADQAVPEWIDKEKLMSRWRDAVNRNGEAQIYDNEHSAVIPNASHALSNDDQAEPRQFLAGKVLGHLRMVEKA